MEPIDVRSPDNVGTSLLFFVAILLLLPIQTLSVFGQSSQITSNATDGTHLTIIEHNYISSINEITGTIANNSTEEISSINMYAALFNSDDQLISIEEGSSGVDSLPGGGSSGVHGISDYAQPHEAVDHNVLFVEGKPSQETRLADRPPLSNTTECPESFTASGDFCYPELKGNSETYDADWLSEPVEVKRGKEFKIAIEQTGWRISIKDPSIVNNTAIHVVVSPCSQSVCPPGSSQDTVEYTFKALRDGNTAIRFYPPFGILSAGGEFCERKTVHVVVTDSDNSSQPFSSPLLSEMILPC